MDLRPTFTWLSKLWTIDHLDLNEWLKEGCVPKAYYRRGIGWFESYKLADLGVDRDESRR